MVYVNDTIVRIILMYIFNMTIKKKSMYKLHSHTRKYVFDVYALDWGTTEINMEPITF